MYVYFHSSRMVRSVQFVAREYKITRCTQYSLAQCKFFDQLCKMFTSLEMYNYSAYLGNDCVYTGVLSCVAQIIPRFVDWCNPDDVDESGVVQNGANLKVNPVLCELVHSRRCRWTWCSVDWCNPECEELKRLVTGPIQQCSFSYNRYYRVGQKVVFGDGEVFHGFSAFQTNYWEPGAQEPEVVVIIGWVEVFSYHPSLSVV